MDSATAGVGREPWDLDGTGDQTLITDGTRRGAAGEPWGANE
jgi:hypothetical protein